MHANHAGKLRAHIRMVFNSFHNNFMTSECFVMHVFACYRFLVNTQCILQQKSFVVNALLCVTYVNGCSFHWFIIIKLLQLYR